MLLNSKGQIVAVAPDAKQPVLIPLREVMQPSRPACGNMFNIEQRARINGCTNRTA